jgi:hypothetical protein
VRFVSDGCDEPRLLHVRSELGYTHDPRHAVVDEPEAVSADEQRRQTQIAHRRERQRRLDAFIVLRDVVIPALDVFAGVVAYDRAVLREVRLIRRGVEAVSRQIAAR